MSNDTMSNDTPLPDPRAEDKELVAQLLSHDRAIWEAAWEKVFAEKILAPILHSRKWCEMVTKIGETPESFAIEVYSDIAKDNYANLRKFRYERSLANWIYKQIGFTMTDRYRRHMAFLKSKTKEVSEKVGGPAHDGRSTLTPGWIAGYREDVEAMNDFLASLWIDNPKHALVWLLFTSEKLRAKVVAAMLGESPDNVYQINKRISHELYAILVQREDYDDER